MSRFGFHRAPARRYAFQTLSVVLSATMTVLPVMPVAAAPQNAHVVRGQASVQQQGNETTIHAGRDAIIEYSQFNVASDEAVRFVQPDAQLRVL